MMDRCENDKKNGIAFGAEGVEFDPETKRLARAFLADLNPVRLGLPAGIDVRHWAKTGEVVIR